MPILVPTRGLLTPARRVPRGKLRIDWRHPLARGLVAAYAPGVMGGHNIANLGGDLTTFESAALIQASVEGPGLRSSSNTSGMQGLAPEGLKGQAAYSMYYRGQVLGNSTGSVDLVSIVYDSAGGTPFDTFGISANSGGLTAGAGRIVWATGSTSASKDSVFTTPVTGQVISWGATGFVNGTVQAYVDGWAAGTTGSVANVASFATSATSTIVLNTYPGLNRFSNTIASVAYIWNRVLSADEMWLLDYDPFGMLVNEEPEAQALFAPANSSASLDAGLYTLTGQAINFRADRRTTLETGIYALGGQDIDFAKVTPPAVQPGNPIGLLLALTYPGTPAANTTITLETGSYALTGQALNTVRGRSTTLAQGSYALTGQDVAFRAARRMTLDTGVYAVQGRPVAFRYSGAPPSAGGGVAKMGLKLALSL